MKYLLIGAVIAGAAWHFLKPESTIDILIQSAETSVVDSGSGIKKLSSVGGNGFSTASLAEPGKITIVEYYVSWCSPCKMLDANFRRFQKARPDVAIRQIKMKDKWNIPWAKQQYNLDIRGTPHILIYDQQGNLLVEDDGNSKAGLDMLYKWMNMEVRDKRV